jgi:NitT/TauT family transport system substrate-binding protein
MLFATAVSAWASPAAEGPAAAAQPGIRVAGLKGPTGVGMVRMLENDALVEGAPVSYEMAASPDIVAARVLTGEVDFAALPTSMAAKLVAGGVRYKMAAVIGYGVLYVVSRDAGVRGASDLKGRTVAAVGKGSAADLAFRHVLAAAGIDPERDITLRYLPHAELAQLAIAGREPLAVLPEPFATKVLLQRPDFRVAVDVQQEWLRAVGERAPLALSVLVVKAETSERRPAVVRAFLQRWAESTAWVNAHPGEAGVLVEKHGLGFAAAEASAAIPRCNIRYVPAGEARPAVEAFLRVLLASAPDAVGGRLPDDAFYLAE